MTQTIQTPRGTSDILPEEAPLWDMIEQKARSALKAYNYREIRTPIYEEKGLFQRSLGQSSDVVHKQLLELASDKEAGYALRPEGTASVVRAYIEHNMERKNTINKLFYIGPMFRGERPQKGRLRQFHQIGAEVIGKETASPYLDAEVIALNVDILKGMGLKDFTIKLNTLGTLKDKENFAQTLREALSKRASKLSSYSQTRLEQNVLRILDSKDEGDRQIVQKLKIGHTYLSEESSRYFDQVKEALDRLGIAYTVDSCLVRGLDYYTHTVYEITASSLGSQDALCAGGRYNHLVKELGGPAVDAMGFAIGIERVILALGEQGFDANPLDAFAVVVDQSVLNYAFELVSVLRSSGVSCDIQYRVASMKSLMRAADKSGARFTLILGDEEMVNKQVTIKDMKTGDQEKIDIEQVREFIRERMV